jgi:hypothetical protein
MSLIEVDPNGPANTTASRTELELSTLEVRRQELLEQKAKEDEIKSLVSVHVRRLAIRLHKGLCPTSHDNLACTWYTDPHADNVNAADWTEVQHTRWLGIAQLGVAIQREELWTVEEPSGE